MMHRDPSEGSTQQPFTVCVFCSSSRRAPEAFKEAARSLAEAIARERWHLVYGGTDTGLMKDLADRAVDLGVHTTGVLPQFMIDRGIGSGRITRRVAARDMRERKALMELQADGFIALPGGIGTLEEIAEILTLKQLEQHSKPIVFLNVSGYYTPLLDWFRGMVEQEIAKQSFLRLFSEARTAEEAVAALREYRPTPAEPKWY